MLQCVLSPEALDDLERVWDFISADNLQAADRLIGQFFDAFDGLAKFPRLGHIRTDLTDRDLRFWPVGSYLIVYREDLVSLQIVAVLHGARDIPDIIRSC